MPSGIALGWSYGSSGNNSDSELVSQQWWDLPTNLVTDSVGWYPYGPLQAYKHSSTYGGFTTATRITRNLAYRITGLYYEAGSTVLHSVTTSEDAKGRTTKRDYTPNIAGVEDSYFLYDDQDRLLCETTSLVTSCPTSGSTIKNSHTASPPFTNAGDWKELKRPIPGSTNLGHVFNPGGYGSSHRVTQIVQDDFLDTNYTYLPMGARSTEDNVTFSHDERIHGYDQRHNKTTTTGWYRDGGSWYGYTAQSAFDAKNRRVYKSFTADKTTSTWFFYYDPLDRLTEVLYTPDSSAPGTYQLFHLLWLGDRLTAYVQIDMPSKTLSKRYVMTDETNRPVEMWNWPSSGDTSRIWAINPSAWGFDTNVLGASYFQPVLFVRQYQDTETGAHQDDGTTVHRPALADSSSRTYDPFVGNYVQVITASPSQYVAIGNDRPYSYLAIRQKHESCGSVGYARGEQDCADNSTAEMHLGLTIVNAQWIWRPLANGTTSPGLDEFGYDRGVARTFAPFGWNRALLSFGLSRCTGPGSASACSRCTSNCYSIWYSGAQACILVDIGNLFDCFNVNDNDYQSCVARCYARNGDCDYVCHG